VAGAVANDTSYLFDVSPLVTGDGTVSFLVKSTSSDGARYYSREAGTAATAPQLQVTCGPTAPGTTSGFTATEDATVDASRPTTALGGSPRIIVDNSPVNDALVKFSVSGLSGCTVSSAMLRLTVGSSTDDNSVYGGDVYATGSTWSQGTVTYANAPAAGTRAGSVTGSVAASTAYLFDVTPLVTGDGTVSFRVKSPNSDGARYFSTEGGTAGTRPQLQVTC